MRRIGLLFIIVFGCFLSSKGQVVHAQEDLESFVSIYMTQKQHSADPSFKMEALLKKHQISWERYAEIFHASLNQKRTPLSKEENLFIQDLQKEGMLFEKEKEKALQKSCEDFSLDYHDYKEILHKYKTSIKFQRSLKPYFDHYINQRK